VDQIDAEIEGATWHATRQWRPDGTASSSTRLRPHYTRTAQGWSERDGAECSPGGMPHRSVPRLSSTRTRRTRVAASTYAAGRSRRSAGSHRRAELWGHTWTPKPQPTTRWWRAGELAAPPGNTDHYVSMGLTEQPGTERTRAKQADVTALLAGAWADVDVVSPWHAKPGLATTHDEALGALTAAMMPTVALRTPGGVQGFWLCETAIELEPAAMRQHLSDVGATFQAHSDVVFDPVWNADRLMRLPGSVHYGSGEPVDVVTLWADGPWWDLDSLGARLVDAGAGQIMSRAATDAYRSIELPAMSQREAAMALMDNPAL
jgi:hypothetical protein